MKSRFKNPFRLRQNHSLEALAEFTRSLALIVDRQQLIDNVISRIRDIADVGSVKVYLQNPEVNQYEEISTTSAPSEETRQITFGHDSTLIQWLTLNETPLHVSIQKQVMSFLHDSERELIIQRDVELIIPLMSMNRFTGMVMLGAKNTRKRFSSREIDMLWAYLSQAAIAFENAFLAEQQKQRLRKMYRTDRLATLGQLAAGAAHEIRNPLAAIRSTIQYLQKYIDSDDHQNMVAELHEEVDRINGIIEGMLSFSRPQPPRIESCDLDDLLSRTIDLVHTTARKQSVVIHYSCNAQTTDIKVDPAQLRQVFLNVIMNALQSMPDGGELMLSIVRQGKAGSSGSRFRVSCRDTGTGIKADQIEHIFDPFYTTKSDGTGLGLSISYGIIRQHDGDIEVFSPAAKGDTENPGTDVVIHLPAKTGQ